MSYINKYLLLVFFKLMSFIISFLLIITTRIKDLNDLTTNKSYKIFNIKDEKIWKVNF